MYECVAFPFPVNGRWRGTRFHLMLALQPVVQILLGLLAGDAVAFLQLPEELVFFTTDDLQVIVGELAKLLANRAFHLFPFAFQFVPR